MNKKDIRNLIQKDNPVIFEIGCNDGYDSDEFLKEFPQVNLYCFEPDERAIERFKKRIIYNYCNLYEFAIGNVNGYLDFYESHGKPPSKAFENYGDWDKSGSIKKPKNHLIQNPWCSFENKKQIPCYKLDTFVEMNDISLIDFIWADVQGAEEDLILGGLNTLNNKTRFLYTEYDNNETYENEITVNKIQELLPNFETIHIFEYDILLKNKIL